MLCHQLAYATVEERPVVDATTDPEQVVRAYFDLWNGRDYAGIPDVVSASYVLYDPIVPADAFGGPAGEVHGPDGLEQYIRAGVRAFPDLHVSLEEVVSRDGLVMNEETFSATHEGELFGLPPTGRRLEVKGMQKFLIADGVVQENYAYYNEQEIKEQFGLTFPTIVVQLPRLAWRKLR